MKKVISVLTLAALALSLNVAVAQENPKKATVKDKKAGCEATCTKKDKASCCPKDKASMKKDAKAGCSHEKAEKVAPTEGAK
jgi:hypothetical protein